MYKSTTVYEKNSKFIFMSTSNQICLTRNIHLLHQGNHGLLGYLYFKDIVPKRMYIWISKFLVPENIYNVDIQAYINKQFIKSCSELYIYKNNDNIENLDCNVFKSNVSVGYCDIDNNDNQVNLQKKKYNELLASDYGSIDVWKEQTTEVSSINNRYANKVPVWQKNMNIRNYDLENQGYGNTTESASLDNFISGYGDDMDKLIKLKNEKYISDNSKLF